jgi:hypothetical protein
MNLMKLFIQEASISHLEIKSCPVSFFGIWQAFQGQVAASVLIWNSVVFLVQRPCSQLARLCHKLQYREIPRRKVSASRCIIATLELI